MGPTIIEHTLDYLQIDAPAKVNLHLEVLGKRPDGYHELETLMVAIDLCDTLHFRPLPTGTKLRSDSPELSMGADNLVSKAVELVRREAGIDQGISITLTKRIPMSAGLAGGSSDAAATLWALNSWWNLRWSVAKLAQLGAQLGSDVPFFFYAPSAICRGRGEQVEPIAAGATLHLVLIRPIEGLSTAAVFRQLTIPQDVRSIESIRRAWEAGDIPAMGRALFNRLEEPAFVLNPAVADLRRQARHWPGDGSLMTGSGSTVFVVCSSRERARALADQLRLRELGSVFVATSCF